MVDIIGPNDRMNGGVSSNAAVPPKPDSIASSSSDLSFFLSHTM